MSLLKRFFDYVEIRTKITSVFPFVMTLGYLFLTGKEINILRTLVFFFGMLCFDLTATTINNYVDTKKNHQILSVKRPTAKMVTILLLFISCVLGLYLVYLTDVVVLVLGGLCFLFGVTYSYGPVPISHGPYGEIISGFFYGFLIPIILYYINAAGELFTYGFSDASLSLEVSIMPVIGLGLLAVLPFSLTANIMLANNICDVKHDILVNRFTLAYYLKRKALYLFAAFYYVSYLSVVVMVIFGFLSPLSLLLILTIIPVQKNINRFFEKQVKKETFSVSIQNFLMMISVHIILLFAGGLLPGWGMQ